ncbi:hypothetical protein CPLU01_15557 [Colletotrichum plurivorum]|uniref:Uncharacterized protein n=1 Tax=Colletotrichum plurivorum TaxID=2175906 RepID=A0A8H6JAR3_9PEZI|nr:hypothetical protein CPLU01_15557 [Colletotrichum plurivorum]
MEQAYNSSHTNGGSTGVGSSLLNDENRRDVWWSFPWRAFNLFDPPDRIALLRRLSAYLIMGMRSLVSFLQAAFALFTFSAIGFLFSVAISLLGFFFAASGLGIIVDAKGRRVVFGLALDRRHLDVFLFVVIIIHALVFFLFFDLYELWARILWVVMCLLIDAVAWVCTWPADGEVYV